jgi:uncharacterized protein
MIQTRLTTRLQIKSLSSMQFDGHGSIFGNVDLGGDVVMPGAFKRTLAEHKSENTLPAMFWMHDVTRVPGKWLDMSEDNMGLATKGELAPTDLGKEIHILLKMDAVSGLSIGYVPKQVDYSSDGVRMIYDADLMEVSIVSLPMNPKAQILHVKSRLSALGEYVPRDDEIAEIKRECEHFLRNKGFSKKMSCKYASNLFTGIGEIPIPDIVESVTLETPSEKNGVTPDEVEVIAGLSEFHEKQLLYDMEKYFTRIFR